jgi:hypothetical protein
MKKCSNKKCKQVKPEFGKNKTEKDGLSHYCKVCAKKLNDTKENRLSKFKYNIKKKYGISLEKYNQMLKDQNHKCKICNIDEVDACKNGHRKKRISHRP